MKNALLKATYFMPAVIDDTSCPTATHIIFEESSNTALERTDYV